MSRAALSASPADTLAAAGAPNPGEAGSLASWGWLVALAVVVSVLLFFAALRRLWTGAWLSAIRSPQGQYGYYLEGFAFWMFLEIPLNLGFWLWNAWTSTPLLPSEEEVILQVVGLLAVLWPVWRGVTWSALRADLGLHLGEGVLRELGAGIVGYLAKGPLLLLGLVSTQLLVLIASSAGSHSPVHPAISTLMNGSGSGRPWLFGAALIGAPLVEELAFRGLLFRYLRSGPGGFSTLARAVPSALVSAIAFALVHPTGVLAIPVLAAEGFALGLVRDWRGSLLAPVVTHALQNGLLLLFLS